MSGEQEKLKIKILGGVEVHYKDKYVGINNSIGKSKKMWVLFEYLVTNYNRNVPQSELIEALWPSEDIRNPANSLKVLVFKLRQEIDRLGTIKGKDVITSVHGSYSFNEHIPHEIDVIEFEKIINQSRSEEISEDEKLEAYYKAFDCFKGAVLTDMQREPWAVSLQTHYNELYKSAMRSCVEILEERGNFDKIIDVCKAALLLQPFEENYYYYLIKAYAAVENFSAASEMYNQVKAVLQKEYGTTPDTKFEGAYKEIMKERPKQKLSVEELTENFAERTNYAASFYVEYGEFKQIYRYIARRLERSDSGAFMCLYSLGVKKGAEVSQNDKNKNLKVLGEALAFTLRQGDVFTRATPNQFAVIFVDIKEENATAIANRISGYFDRNKKSDSFGIIHSIAKIEPSAFETKNRQRK